MLGPVGTIERYFSTSLDPYSNWRLAASLVSTRPPANAIALPVGTYFTHQLLVQRSALSLGRPKRAPKCYIASKYLPRSPQRCRVRAAGNTAITK